MHLVETGSLCALDLVIFDFFTTWSHVAPSREAAAPLQKSQQNQPFADL